MSGASIMFVVGVICLALAIILPMRSRRGADLVVPLSLAARVCWSCCIGLTSSLLPEEKLAMLAAWVALEAAVYVARRGHARHAVERR